MWFKWLMKDFVAWLMFYVTDMIFSSFGLCEHTCVEDETFNGLVDNWCGEWC